MTILRSIFKLPSALIPFILCALSAPAQAEPGVPRRVTQPIDEAQVTTLHGYIHSAATPDNDRGAVADTAPVGEIILILRRSPEQQQDLDAFVDRLHNTRSDQFHQWLTPAEFGSRFGPADEDVAAVAAWLKSKGFTIDDLPPSKTHITFTGNAGQMRDAFHVDIHHLSVNGEAHQATVTEPEIPSALAPVVAGFRQLHDFDPTPGVTHADTFVRNLKTGKATRVASPSDGPHPALTVNYNDEVYYEVGPQDFYTIYDENPLLARGITGAGVTIAVIEQTQIDAADVATFRSVFGLPAYPATPNSTDGGVNYIYGTASGVGGDSACIAPPAAGAGNANQPEASLDVEWAGVVAPKATIDFVACGKNGSSISSAGIDLAAEHIVNYLSNTVRAASLSYGECESELGTTAAAYYSSLWEQFAAEGITAVVSSGDSGPDRCDQNSRAAGSAPSVNGLASSDYNVTAGGTDFSDAYISNNYATMPASTWWNPTNGTGDSSAKSYIPEKVWGGRCSDPFYVSYLEFNKNTDYGTNYTPGPICFGAAEAENYAIIGVSGGGGGVSLDNPLPTWQSVYGVGLYSGSTTQRNLPDIALFAASGFWGHILEFCDSSRAPCSYDGTTDDFQTSGAGGTSFVAPQVAGLMALVNQKTGARQGQADYTLYNLAVKEYGTAAHPNDSTLASCSGSAKGAAVGSTCIFHDIAADTPSLQGGEIASATLEPCYSSFAPDCYTSVAGESFGISSVPGASSTMLAYYAGAGYDLTTGLGSVNIDNLVEHWTSASPTFATSTALAASATSLSGTATATLTATVTATGRGGTVAPAGYVKFFGGPNSGQLVGAASIAASCSGTGSSTACKGVAKLTASAAKLLAGTNKVDAVFEGDGANDAPSTSAAVTIANGNQAQALTFKALPKTATYGAAITLSGTPGASGNPVTFSLLSGPGTVSGATLTLNGVGTVVVAANEAGNGTYAAAKQITQSITVGKAVLTLTANNASRDVGQANPAFSGKFTGFVNGDTAGKAVTGKASYSTTAKIGSPAGTYPITPALGTLAAANYTFAFKNGTLTVKGTGSTATPVIASGSGAYPPAKSIEITDATAGAVIYYTTNGKPPTTASTQYNSDITVASSETIKAIAVAPGYAASAVATAAITIN